LAGKQVTSKTFRIGDLVRYNDVMGSMDKSVGTIIGWSEATWRQHRAKVQWFDWCGSGPNETTEYFNELEVISGESK
jgi:hypothetical protein